MNKSIKIYSIIKTAVPLLVAISAIILFFYVAPDYHIKHNGCDLHQEIYRRVIHSKINNKFIDYKNHANKTVNFIDENDEENYMIFPSEFRNMFDSIKVGDSLFKEKSQLIYKVKSNTTGKVTSFKFYTLCKDSISQDSIHRSKNRAKYSTTPIS